MRKNKCPPHKINGMNAHRNESYGTLNIGEFVTRNEHLTSYTVELRIFKTKRK